MEPKSIVNEIRVDRIQLSDTTQPLLAIRYNRASVAGDLPTEQVRNVTIAIDPTGGGSSKLRVVITKQVVDENGDAGTDLTYTYDGVTGGSGTVTAVTATLAALVEELNKIPGITAWALNALGSYSLATDDFITVAATDIPPTFMQTLYKDASEIYTSAVRIGIPEVRDSGRMKILGVAGTLTGATSGTVKVYRDDPDRTGDPVELFSFAMVNSTETAYMDYNILEAPTVQGPIVVVLSSNDLTACDIKVRTVQAEW